MLPWKSHDFTLLGHLPVISAFWLHTLSRAMWKIILLQFIRLLFCPYLYANLFVFDIIEKIFFKILILQKDTLQYYRINTFIKIFSQNKQLYYACVTYCNIQQYRYIFLTEFCTKHVMLDYNTTVIHCHVNCLTRTGWRSTPYISNHFTLSKNLYSADEGTSPLKKK